jgi:hypothetical protein
MNEDAALTTIRIAGLSQADAADLEELVEERSVPAEAVRLEEEALPTHRLGEPITFLLVAAATTAGIGTLGSFLMKKRKSENLRYTVEVVYADGTTKREVLELSRSASDAPDPEVIEKLAAITKLPIEQLVHGFR